jgi:hypothetical protein
MVARDLSQPKRNLKTYSEYKPRSKTYWVERVVHPERLGALPIADPPAEYVLHPSRHFCLGDLALHDPCGVGLPPVLEGSVGGPDP